jgi:hypothetical protein
MDTCNQNFKEMIEVIREWLALWALRKITRRGKFQVVNTLILPQLLYPSTVYLCRKDIWMNTIAW